jgi:hypothetical protein
MRAPFGTWPTASSIDIRLDTRLVAAGAWNTQQQGGSFMQSAECRMQTGDYATSGHSSTY